MVATKTLTIAIVAIVVVAGIGIGVYALANGNGSKTSGTGTMTLTNADVQGKLEVYGNVDGDLDIDADDKKALNDAIAAGTTSKLWKYADANHDGTIDAADATKIDAILGATVADPVTVWHINRYRSATNTDISYDVESTYPIDKIMSTGAGNTLQFFRQINVISEIVGIAYSSQVDSTLLSDYQFLFQNESKYKIGASAGDYNKDGLLTVKSATGAKTLITGDDNTYAKGDGKGTTKLSETEIEALGIDVIRIAPASTDFSKQISDMALVQFFLGKTKDLLPLQEFLKDTLTELNNLLEEKVGEGKKYSVVNFAAASYSSYSKQSDGTVKTSDGMSKLGSDYTNVGLAAGGSYALKDAASVSSQNNGGSWLNDYHVDKITVSSTGNGYSWYGGTAKVEGQGLEKVTERIMAFYLSEPFYNEEVYVISGDMPILMRIIYTAHIYYPDVISKEWADGINKDYTSAYYGLTTKQIENGDYFFSMQDLEIEGH